MAKKNIKKFVETDFKSAFTFKGERSKPLPILDKKGKPIPDEKLKELGLI